MAEYLINTMNRQDNSPADLVLMTGRTPVYAHNPHRESRRGFISLGVVMVFLR